MDFRWLGREGKDVLIRPYNGVFVPPQFATDEWVAANRKSLRTGIVIDTETTGLDAAKSIMIEVGAHAFLYSVTDGIPVRVIDTYEAMQDPGGPLPERITKLTGLTDADLAGQIIHASRLADLMASASIIIAHNASFDRPFIDRFLARRSVGPIRATWACSIQQVAWEAHGLPSSKLEALCALHGFYCTAHRAGADAAALLKLLSHPNEVTKQTYLHELLEMSRAPWVVIQAHGSPFETKDVLKDRGYSWAAGRKVWQRVVTSDALASDEMKWLGSAVYRGANKATASPIEATARFAEGA